MNTKPSGKKGCYWQPPPQFKDETMKMVVEFGVAIAAKDLGLHELQRYNWRKDKAHACSISEREAPLATENAHLPSRRRSCRP